MKLSYLSKPQRLIRPLIGGLALFIVSALLCIGLPAHRVIVLAQGKEETTQRAFSNPSAITIGDNTTATPYPSNIDVAGLTGAISRITVRLNRFTHATPEDVDIMLVGPGGINAIIMSDIGNSVPVSGVMITLDDRAQSGLPIGIGPFPSGTYRPTNSGAGDVFPGGPLPFAGSALNVFCGLSPNATWSLYVVDDEGGGAGSIAGGWSLDIATTATAPSNANDMQIPTSGPATIYPTVLNVSGVTGTITKVRVRMNNLAHSIPDDLDVMVVGPQGQNALLMSDVGGSNTIPSPIGLVFDDEAPASLPDSGQITDGTYRPTNFGAGDTFNAPAPAPSGTSALSTFVGTNPNGQWQLFIMDDTGPSGSGFMSAGWALEISTSNTSITPDIADFDGDNKTDIGVFRPSNGTWYITRSLGSSLLSQHWGLAGDRIVPGDFDGDNRADFAVWRASGGVGTFYVIRSSDSTVVSMQWGSTGDDPTISQDFDGDGRTDFAVYRSAAQSTFYVLRSSTGTILSQAWGNNNDRAIAGDYDGDGKADIAVYRTNTGIPANSYLILSSSNGAFIQRQWGTFTTDFVCPGDYDGDGKADFAVFRFMGAQAGSWFILQSSNNQFRAASFGTTNDSPVPGDYDGDGKTDLAVSRVVSGSLNWFVLRSADNSVSGHLWGSNGDVLVPAYQTR